MLRSRYEKRTKRRIGIPKGMLLHMALNILHSKPISGSELMDEIEYYTDWRPSPGSIYPLFSKLVEQGLIEIVESEDPFMKRYVLTRAGEEAIEERQKLEPRIRSHYYSTQKMYWRLFRGMDENLFEAYLRLLKAIEEAHPSLKKDPEAISKTRDLLIETAMKVEEIGRQLEKTQ